jgi:hypothetical protein
VREQVDLMDPVTERRATALGRPLAAPRHREVVGVAEPERLTHGDQGASERAALQQRAHVCGGRSGALLEDDRKLSAGGIGGGPLVVEFIVRRRRRILDVHVRTRCESGERLLTVWSRRRADEHDVGLLGGEHLVEVAVGGSDAVSAGELLGLLEAEIGDGDELCARVRGDGAGVRVGHGSGAHQGSAKSLV